MQRAYNAARFLDSEKADSYKPHTHSLDARVCISRLAAGQNETNRVNS
jgi:hypothetical protein